MNKIGLVVKSTGNQYEVKVDGKIFLCFIRGKLRIDDINSTNPVVVGDNVAIDIINEKKQQAIITKILDRKNYLVRKSVNYSKRYHIIAANVDTAFLIVTIAAPETSTEFIDRFLVSAEAYRIPVVIVFNKVDLYCDEDIEYMEYLIKIYENIGYKCIRTSATENINIEKLKKLMNNKINVISGHSGVGKSTLIKKLNDKLDIKIGNISVAHLKGKHTTSYASLYEIEKNSYIIDTPGLKAFGVIDIEKEELYHFFPEIFKYSTDCKYYNCTHIHEPDCSVKIAVENGKISESRYYNYLNMFNSDNNKHRAAY